MVRVAENASAKHGAREKERQSNAVGGPLLADGLIGLSGKERGVWGGGVVNGWPDETNGDKWDGVYGGKGKAFVGGSGLDVNAPPFRMERAMHGRAERL